MCGIGGILCFSGRSPDSFELEKISNSLAHRGPDGAGVYIDGPAGIIHRRLAIIDPTGGHQPIGNEDGSVNVTFNGEIYNFRELQKELESKGHRFRTSSDTEVIVHAWEEWGSDCVLRLRGMFAFAVWDTRHQTLFLARDRVGIKPLVYTVQNDFLAFASEIQGLTCLSDLSLTPSIAAIDLYLHYQYIPAPHSIYNEICKLPPGHTLLLQLGKPVPKPRRYWSMTFQADRSLSESQWIERLDAALTETVKTHLVSDVPFGAFLSGGLDSSTVVSYMSRLLSDPVKTFCIGHEDSKYDERNWASEAARICGAEYYEEVVEPEGLELLPLLVRHYGEPFADSSAIPTWYVSRLARNHVKMVLSGDGGDELFAGYYAYAAVLSAHRNPPDLSGRLRHSIGNQLRYLGLKRQLPSMADSTYARSAILPVADRASLWKKEFLSVIVETRAQFDHEFSRGGSAIRLDQLQCFDINNYLPYDNLTKVDIASMCHGLEVRVPFLDHVFLETVAAIPPELRLRPNADDPSMKLDMISQPSRSVGKYILKRNAERLFGHEFVHRQKRGFEVPVQNWMAGTHKEELRERLGGQNSKLTGYFEQSAVDQLVSQSGDSKVGAWKTWSLLVLDEWLEQQSAGTKHPSKALSAST